MDFIVRYGPYFFTPLHVLVCVVLIAVVLLQTGKGTDWAGVFGGGGTQTAFGPRGVENTLSRLTKIAAIVFMITSFSLSLLQSRARRGGLENLGLPAKGEVKKKASPTPALPGLPATASPSPGPSEAGASGAASPGVTAPAPLTATPAASPATAPQASPTPSAAKSP